MGDSLLLTSFQSANMPSLITREARDINHGHAHICRELHLSANKMTVNPASTHRKLPYWARER
jgi:hypothetical protein